MVRLSQLKTVKNVFDKAYKNKAFSGVEVETAFVNNTLVEALSNYSLNSMSWSMYATVFGLYVDEYETLAEANDAMNQDLYEYLKSKMN